jgi:hypothetical protein
MPKEYQVTVRGKQRKEIDADLFMQALVLLVEEFKAKPEPGPSTAGEPSLEEGDA